jgi:hypothetical protein
LSNSALEISCATDIVRPVAAEKNIDPGSDQSDPF